MAALRVAARRSIIWKSACVKMEKCGRRSRGACAIEARTRSFDNASVAHNNSGTQISFPLIGNSKVTEQAVDRAPRAVAEKDNMRRSRHVRRQGFRRRRRNMSKWTFGAVVIGVLIAGAAVAAEPDSLLSQIKQRGSIMICEAAYPPYNVKNTKSGEWEGLDVDIEAEIAKDLGVKIERVDTSFAGLIPSINTHKCDLSSAATYITPARAEQVLFTRAYAAETKTIFVPVNSTAKTYEDIDKPGVTIVTRSGTAEETYR